MKTYYVRFGTGDPRSATFVGLAPTFLIFNNYGTGVTPPGITSVIGATGYYAFLYGTTTPIAFLIDGATSSLTDGQRYVSGSIDPVDRMDEVGATLVAIGTTSVALGVTTVALGVTSVALGVTTVALGNTLLAYGLTTAALGNTALAFGTTSVALGNTLLAYGLTTAALGNTILAFSTTLVAIGTSHIAQGVTLTAIGTTGVALGNTGIAFGTTNVALGTTNVALGTTSVALGNTIYAIALSLYAQGITLSLINSFIGSTASSFGTNLADPVDLFGYAKRVIENLEGNQSFTKVSGALAIYSRGSSQLLITKAIANSVSMVVKT